MSAPSTQHTTHVIHIRSDGNAESATVRNGDKVQWEAPARDSAWVDPPDIFVGGHCKSGTTITLSPGETGPEPACVVSGKDGSHFYSCGVGHPRVPLPKDGGEIIIVSGEPHGYK